MSRNQMFLSSSHLAKNFCLQMTQIGLNCLSIGTGYWVDEKILLIGVWRKYLAGLPQFLRSWYARHSLLKKLTFSWYNLVQMPQKLKWVSNSWSATPKTPGNEFFRKLKIFEKRCTHTRVIPMSSVASGMCVHSLWPM